MKKKYNKLFLNFMGIALILFPAISCSGSGQEKVQKVENKNTPVKIETEKTNIVKESTCATCHTTDENGDLSFKSINGKLIMKEKTPENLKH